ncbi:MAG: hypothetical protein ACJ8GN_23045 [Longimicrobiaceae bacterium]
MRTGDDFQAEHTALLIRARNPALVREDAENILGRSAELVRRHPSERAAALHAQIEIAVRISRVRLPPSPRMAALGQRLRGRDAVHIGALAVALRELDFHAADELTTAETLYFQSVTAEPLAQTAELYRGGDELAPSRLRAAVAELHALGALIPACAAEAATAVRALADELEARAGAADARACVERLNARLDTLLRGRPPSPRTIAAAREELERNPWAGANPGHPEVREAEERLGALEARRGAADLIANLAARVREALAAGEPGLGRAIVLIADAHLRADAARLDDAGALRAAAGQVAGSAAGLLGALVADAPDALDGDAALDALLTRTRRAEQAIGWLRQLPASLREHVSRQEEEFGEVLAAAAQRSGELLAERIRHDLARLPAGEAAAYAARLQADEHPMVRWHGERLARLAGVEAELADAGDTLDDAVLERFASETAALPDGPLKETLTTALAECRAARSGLATLLRDAEADDHPERVRVGLEGLQRRFSRWTQPRDALRSLADRALLRQIRELGPGPGAHAEAVRLAGALTDSEGRERVLAALRHLADARAAVDALASAAAGAEEQASGERVAEVARLARGLLALVAADPAGSCAAELPALWDEVDDRARAVLMTRVPALLERWVNEAAHAAPSVEALDGVRKEFEAVVEGLGDVFPADRGVQLLERRRVKLLFAPLQAAGEFDRALELLRRSADAFRPDELAAAEGELVARKALAAFARDGAAAIAGVTDAVLRHGPTDELMEALLENFTLTGVTAPLAAVARGCDTWCERFRGVAQLARWCLRFERGDFDALVAELHAREAKGMRDDFVAAVTRAPGREAQAFYVLRGVQDTGDRDERDRIARALGELTVRLETAHTELLAEVDALEGALNDLPDRSPPPPSAALEEVRAAAGRAREVVAGALTSVRRWQESTAAVAGWTHPAAIPRRASATLERLAALRTRLQTNDGVLAAVEETLSAGPGSTPERWSQLQYRIVALGTDAVAPVAALLETVHGHVLGQGGT